MHRLAWRDTPGAHWQLACSSRGRNGRRNDIIEPGRCFGLTELPQVVFIKKTGEGNQRIFLVSVVRPPFDFYT